MNTLLTVHTLTALPWHNLNRDETGAPKQVTEGGVVRARLSSQSLKRAARVAFERSQEERERSVRTKVGVSMIVDRIAEIRGGITESERKKLTTAVAKRVLPLTQSSIKEDEEASKKDTLVWLSAREVEKVALAFAAESNAEIDVIESSVTDSLAIASFGRMFANQPRLNLPAAISVGNAVTTHPATVELDWFAAVDDAQVAHQGAGQLGFSMQTTGVYYRSFTIDRAQLLRNLGRSDFADGELDSLLRDLIEHVTLALPSGRSAGTAASTLPALIVAEKQRHRVVYDFHQPVRPKGDGGYLEASIEALAEKVSQARVFSPSLFGETLISGASGHLMSDDAVSFDRYVDFILQYLHNA